MSFGSLNPFQGFSHVRQSPLRSATEFGKPKLNRQNSELMALQLIAASNSIIGYIRDNIVDSRELYSEASKNHIKGIINESLAGGIGEDLSLEASLNQISKMIDALTYFQPDVTELMHALNVIYSQKDSTSLQSQFTLDIAQSIVSSYTTQWQEVLNGLNELPEDLINDYEKAIINREAATAKLPNSARQDKEDIQHTITMMTKRIASIRSKLGLKQSEDVHDIRGVRLKNLKDEKLNPFLEKTKDHLSQYRFKPFYVRHWCGRPSETASENNVHFQSILLEKDNDKGCRVVIFDSLCGGKKTMSPFIKDQHEIDTIIKNIGELCFVPNPINSRIKPNLQLTEHIFPRKLWGMLKTEISRDYAQSGLECGVKCVKNLMADSPDILTLSTHYNRENYMMKFPYFSPFQGISRMLPSSLGYSSSVDKAKDSRKDPEKIADDLLVLSNNIINCISNNVSSGSEFNKEVKNQLKAIIDEALENSPSSNISLEKSLNKICEMIDSLNDFQPDATELFHALTIIYSQPQSAKKLEIAKSIVSSHTPEWRGVMEGLTEMPEDLIGGLERREKLRSEKMSELQRATGTEKGGGQDTISTTTREIATLRKKLGLKESEGIHHLNENRRNKLKDQKLSAFLNKTKEHLSQNGFKPFYVRHWLRGPSDHPNFGNSHYQSILLEHDRDKGYRVMILDSLNGGKKTISPFIKDQKDIDKIIKNIGGLCVVPDQHRRIAPDGNLSERIFPKKMLRSIKTQISSDYVQNGVECGVKCVKNVIAAASELSTSHAAEINSRAIRLTEGYSSYIRNNLLGNLAAGDDTSTLLFTATPAQLYVLLEKLEDDFDKYHTILTELEKEGITKEQRGMLKKQKYELEDSIGNNTVRNNLGFIHRKGWQEILRALNLIGERVGQELSRRIEQKSEESSNVPATATASVESDDLTELMLCWEKYVEVANALRNPDLSVKKNKKKRFESDIAKLTDISKLAAIQVAKSDPDDADRDSKKTIDSDDSGFLARMGKVFEAVHPNPFEDDESHSGRLDPPLASRAESSDSHGFLARMGAVFEAVHPNLFEEEEPSAIENSSESGNASAAEYSSITETSSASPSKSGKSKLAGRIELVLNTDRYDELTLDQINKLSIRTAKVLIDSIGDRNSDNRPLTILSLCTGEGRLEAHLLNELKDKGVNVGRLVCVDLQRGQLAKVKDFVEANELVSGGVVNVSSFRPALDWLNGDANNVVDFVVSSNFQIAVYGPNERNSDGDCQALLAEVSKRKPGVKQVGIYSTTAKAARKKDKAILIERSIPSNGSLNWMQRPYR